MNTREIEALIEKYYEGETSLDEERILREFFSGPGVPGHLATHSAMFAWFDSELDTAAEDAAFEAKMDALLSSEDQGTPVVPFRRDRGRILYFSGIAASVLLVVGLFFTFRQDVFKAGQRDRMAVNTQAAYAEASEALLIVSSNLNNGLKVMGRLEAMDKAMKNLQLFNKFYQYQSIIINPDVLNQPSKK
jgi:hypothetical protein